MHTNSNDEKKQHNCLHYANTNSTVDKPCMLTLFCLCCLHFNQRLESIIIGSMALKHLSESDQYQLSGSGTGMSLSLSQYLKEFQLID